MPLSPQEWHERFCQQARWTHSLRDYLYRRAGLRPGCSVLDVGCGTGVLAAELIVNYGVRVCCLDMDWGRVVMAMRKNPEIYPILADAHYLPFSTASFDFVLSHFLFLWLADPLRALCEMKRLTRPGGAVLALAEPDYGGRIDHPPELQPLGDWQAEALRQQGADPFIGRKLSALFHTAGLRQVETGVLGGQWTQPPQAEEWQSEWNILDADLAQDLHHKADLEKLKQADWQAWQSGVRTLYVPTFYAWGRVPA